MKEVVLHKKHNVSFSSESKSFIDSYLEEILKNNNEFGIHESFTGIFYSFFGIFNANFNGFFSSLFWFDFFIDEQLLAICLDFFQAGTETTSNTLSFGLMYMIHNEDICKKVQTELDLVVGKKRLPNLSDRNHLPYVEAVLCEIQRYANVAPLGIAHRSMESVKFFNHIIPKDTVMIVSLYSLNMDREYWKDPHVFRPERFLNSSGELIQHSEQFFPFGLGRF